LSGVSTFTLVAWPRRPVYLPAARVLLGVWCLAACPGCGGFSSQGLNAEGVRLFEQTRVEDAMQQFQRAIDHDPANADGYYNLAASHHRIGLVNRRASDLAQAERYYYLCLDRDPEHSECYRGLAVLLVEQNRGEEAFRLLQAWADRRPNSSDPKIELARLCEEFGDRERAKQQLSDALLADATNPRALAALGRIREQDGDRVQALSNYQQSLWANRFQPEVASRVAALQSSIGGTYAGTPSFGTSETVSRGPSPLR
jgi:tetratricopeptide (TPR) repeat protein